jgi:NAD(P)-dependent dehydrogenase (short-subunit alcohol dehydrogenase family)
MEDGLAGRTIVVTGAARGQGAPEAELRVNEGANVIGRDFRDEGKALAERLAAVGPGTKKYGHLEIPVDGGDTSHGGAKPIVDALAGAHKGRAA